MIMRTAAEDDLAPEPILGKLAQQGIKLNVALCTDSVWGVKAAVREGVGVGLAFREAVALDDRRGDLKIIKLADVDTEINSYLAFHGERPLSPPAQCFLAFLRQWRQIPACGVKRFDYSNMAPRRRIHCDGCDKERARDPGAGLDRRRVVVGL